MADKIALEEEEYQDTDSTTTALGLYCRDLYTEYSSSQYRRRKLDEIEDGRKRYDNDRPAKKFPWENASNKSLGLTAIAVDNLEPRIVNKLIGEDDFIQVKPTGEDDLGSVDDVKEFLHWACHSNIKIKKHIKPVVHDLLMDGTKDVLCLWEEKDIITRTRGTQPVFEDMEGNRVSLPQGLTTSGNPQQVMQMIMQMGLRPAGSEEGFEEKSDTEFKVRLEGLKVEDCFYPDHNDRWEDQPFLRMIYPTLGDLVELQEQGIYKNIDNTLVKGSPRDTTDDEDRKEIAYSQYGQECPLLECYVEWEGEWRVATYSIEAGWAEVRNQPMHEVFWHGRKPVHRFTIYPKSNESMGVGIPTKIVNFAKGMDDLYNQMIDAGTIEIIPYGFFNQSSTGMMAAKQHKIFPGAMLPIPKDSQVHFPSVGGRSAMFVEFINVLLTFFERTLSLMDYSAGTRSSTTGQGGDTASGMNMILQEGNIKHNYTGDQLQDTFADVLTDILSLYAQNMPLSAKMRLFEGNKWVFQPVNIQALQGRYDITIDVSDSSANTMTNRREKMGLAQQFKGHPAVDQTQLVKDVYQAFGIKDMEKRINPAWGMISQAMQEAPELGKILPKMIQQFMQQKQQKEREQQIAGEAKANIERQAIQRNVEAPYENQKMVDQANESFKRKLVGQVIEQIGGIPDQSPAENITPIGG